MTDSVFLPKEEYVYRECMIRMSKLMMADLLYAAIITKSGLPEFFSACIYGYDRKQNSYNNVDVHIHPSQIGRFEEISGVTLLAPSPVRVCGGESDFRPDDDENP